MPKDNATVKQRLFYPFAPNFDNSIISKENVTFIVFCWGTTFDYFEFDRQNTSWELPNQQQLTIQDDQVYLEQEQLQLNKLINCQNLVLIVKRYQDLVIKTTNLPNTAITISNQRAAPLSGLNQMAGQEILMRPSSNKKQESSFEYDLGKINAATKTYFNDQLVKTQLAGKFEVGDSFFVNGLYIEMNPQQFKITEVFGKLWLDERYFIEETFKPLVPIDFPEYTRSPRIRLAQPDDKVPVNNPKPADRKPSNLLRMLIPSLGMLAASVLMTFVSGMNLYMMMGMGSMSLITVLMTLYLGHSDKKKFKKEQLEKRKDYEQYLFRINSKLRALHQRQAQALLYQYPNMRELFALVKSYHHRIYEKKNTDDDFLDFQLGTGTVKSSYQIDFSANQELKDDLLYQKLEKLVVTPMQTLSDAPVSLNMQHSTVGMAGEPTVIKTALQTIILQLATFQSYEETQFIVLVSEASASEWLEFRWLKHFMLNEMGLRGLVFNEATKNKILKSFGEILKKRKQRLREIKDHRKYQFSTQYVLIIMEDKWLKDTELDEFLNQDLQKLGVTVIWTKASVDKLPETVNTLIDFQNADAAVLINYEGKYVNQSFRPLELPSEVNIRNYIAHLANLDVVMIAKSSIPEKVSFLDLYHVKRVDQLQIKQRWDRANPIKSLAVPLGFKSKDDLIDLDLNEKAHGPHGLVAGTTGSGKSEMLQSYLLSLAVNFSPEDVGFLPIDFKGGGMANLFRGLPQLMGSITNLDGPATKRALASIKAELQKRQRLFDQFGVNSINGYTELYRKGKQASADNQQNQYPEEPLPHLFLISDEFAELKDNEPEFMTELVSTARIGRSLGVHLILATQKPAGVVNDQIWSNSRFHLALKMQDEADSKEVLKTPDAARITQPGRAYLQVGNNEVYELFQTAWSGADYQPKQVKKAKPSDKRVWKINELGGLELVVDQDREQKLKAELLEEKPQEVPTQLEAVVAEVAKINAEFPVKMPQKPWLPPLPAKLVTPVIDVNQAWQQERNLQIPLGKLDLPKQQTQRQFDFDLGKQSHTAIFGSPGYGKSTVIQTLVLNLARQNTPEQVQFNLFDFGAHGLFALNNLPHTVDIVSLDGPEKLSKMLQRIQAEIKQRKIELLKAGVSSYKEYEATTDQHFTVQVTILDGYDAIIDDKHRDAVDAVINEILRQGASLGMYLLITASRVNAIRSSMRSDIETKMSLYLLDNDDLVTLYGKDRIKINDILGRGEIGFDEPTEIQFYLPVSGETSAERVKNLKVTIDDLDNSWAGPRPDKLPMVPEQIEEFDFVKDRDVRRMAAQMELPLGYQYRDAKPTGINFKEVKFFSLLYEDDLQQLLMLQRIILGKELMADNLELIVIDPESMISDTTKLKGHYFDSDQLSMAETAIEKLDQDHPAIVYILNADEFLEKVTSEHLNDWLKHGYKNGQYFILGYYYHWLLKFSTASSLVKENNKDGILLMRQNDQNIIDPKESVKEPDLKDDEGYVFHRRRLEKIKMVKFTNSEEV